MARRVSSPPLGSSSAHRGAFTSVPPSANQAPLDLNLSEKAPQISFKGHDETESVHHKVSEASTSSLPVESVQKTSNVLTSSANGRCIVSNAEGLFDQIAEEKHAHDQPSQQRQDVDAVSAAKIALNDPSITVVDDRLPVASEPALAASAGRKRKSPRVEAGASAQKELLQSGPAVLEDGSPLGNGPTPTSPSLKRKSPRVKQTTPDTTKKVILALEANDDEGFARSKGRPCGTGDVSKDMVLDTPRSRSKFSASKGGTPDLAERRLLLEERKIRLAEQRFALEEKKLEATIEIGKGLIISMERMTNTISNLGNTSSRHR